MSNKIKQGDLIYVKYCRSSEWCDNHKICVGSIREVINDIEHIVCEKIYFMLEEFKFCSLMYYNVREISDREKFLYYTHGPLVLKNEI